MEEKYYQVMQKYPYPIIKETISRRELTILGVSHTKEFFDYYNQLFEDFVDKNDAIVLEQIAGGDFWEDNGFFGTISELARKRSKKIYQVDPVSSGNIILELGVAIGGSLMLPKAGRFSMSRRDALKRLGRTAIGFSLIFGSLPMQITKDALTQDYSYGIDDLLLYGSSDYRNIVIATGLERLCKELPGVRTIGAIHGAAHSEPIHEYLMHPMKRLKRLAYIPHDMVGNIMIREHTPTASGWETAYF